MRRRDARPDWAKFQSVAMRQRYERRNGKPNPQRITAALDMCGLYGPEVDLACGVEEPAVDEWEAGTRVPTPEQVEALALLTGRTPSWFYRDDLPSVGKGFICGDDGCLSFDNTPSAPVVPLHPTTLF